MSTKKDLDALMRRFVDRGLPGASLSVMQGEKPLYEEYYGYADIARTKPLGPDTIFRMHSISKVVSSVCGMMQYERGFFLMDDPVYEYLPEFRDLTVSVKKPDGTWAIEKAKETMTIRHCFNMNVGFYAHDGSPTETGLKEMHDRLGGSKFQAGYDLRTETRGLASVPMLFESGSHWQYGYGLNIMATVVEVTSGMKLSDFMRKNIFEPLGMESTGFRFRPGWRERLADCVRRLPDGSYVPCTELMTDPLDAMYREDAAYEAPDAGLLSSLGDIQKLSAMLANGGTLGGERILGRKTVAMMHQNLLNDAMLAEFHASQRHEKGYGYGYGVRTLIDTTEDGTNGSIGEFGWLGAAGAWMMADPAERVSAAFMVQDMMPDSRYYNNRLRAVINGLVE